LVAQICAYDLAARGYQDVLTKATNIALQGADLTPKMTKTFEGAAIYADELKSAKIDEFNEMHFNNFVFNPNGLTVREEADQPNALAFIYKAIDTFNSTRQGPYTWTDTFLLRMLIHIVGDMHQPLHMTTMYLEEYPKGDEGGNKFKIHYSNKSDEEAERLGLPTNLHAYWDQGAAEFPSFPIRPLPEKDQIWIATYADQMWKNYSRASFDKELAEKNITKWGLAVFNTSRDTLYPPLLNNGHTITPNYTDTMFPIMKQLITLAGYRLSDILVSLLANSTREPAVRDPRPQRLSDHFRKDGFVAKKIRKSKKPKQVQ